MGENSYSVVSEVATGTDPASMPGVTPLFLVSNISSDSSAVHGGAAPSASAAIPPYLLADAGGAPVGDLGIRRTATTAGLSAAVPAVSMAELTTLRSVPLLRQLGYLPERTLSSFLSAHPAIVPELLAAPPAATEVTGWWASLDSAATATLAEAAPQLVGNLEGIPASVRNEANRRWLNQSITSREDTAATSDSRTLAAQAERELHMLGEVEDALGTQKSVPARSLLSVDPEGQGRAAVVLGDLAEADYVTFLVPGMFFTIDGQINDWTDDAARIYDEQVSWLNLISETDSEEAAKTVAVIAWMGYETPNLTNIGSLDLAEKGRDALAGAIQGLLAERSSDEPYVSVVAHSYGTTAALMAVTEYDFSIDALALVGSPGSAAQSVDELHVRDGNVFVGEAAWDPVPNTAFFGSDPGSESFGAHQMNVGGGVDLITNEVLAASIGHNGYFGAGSESVRNLALIGIGQTELVTEGSADDKEKTLALLHR
ncbi:alpha/beta hydrolase [Glaciihabitans tibetensis]|uniref:alpha/beta hydrolase n=1 Tax=Glaciihabitans tibetensis TaxID=1266600 RepID=UPI0011B2062C|nr:alpha/beta hydrolase [Glaciihabitans tibetensis]